MIQCTYQVDLPVENGIANISYIKLFAGKSHNQPSLRGYHPSSCGTVTLMIYVYNTKPIRAIRFRS